MLMAVRHLLSTYMVSCLSSSEVVKKTQNSPKYQSPLLSYFFLFCESGLTSELAQGGTI